MNIWLFYQSFDTVVYEGHEESSGTREKHQQAKGLKGVYDLFTTSVSLNQLFIRPSSACLS